MCVRWQEPLLSRRIKSPESIFPSAVTTDSVLDRGYFLSLGPGVKMMQNKAAVNPQWMQHMKNQTSVAVRPWMLILMKKAWAPWQVWANLGPFCTMATNCRSTQPIGCPIFLSSLWKVDSLHISACLPSTVGDRQHPGKCQPLENLLLTVFISVK